MSQMNSTAVKTYSAEAAMDQYMRVKYSATFNVEPAGSTDAELGCTERPVFEAGDDVPVRMRSAEGTCIMVADGAIALGADVFAGAAGKVSAAGTLLVGTAEAASTADGDYIEVLRS